MKILVVLVISFLTPTIAWERFDSLKWSPGDKIGCQLHGFLGVFNFKHWMLAADSQSVIHIIGEKFDGWVLKQQRNEVGSNMFKREKCLNAGQGKYGASAVSRAQRFVGEKHKYSLLSCNCGHYVRHWADGAKIC